MTKIEITYGEESCILTCDLSQASAPLRVDGDQIQYQTADARHRTDLAVALACRVVWPDAKWPVVPLTGSIAADFAADCEAWDEMSYAVVEVES